MRSPRGRAIGLGTRGNMAVLTMLFLPSVVMATVIPPNRRISWSPGIPGGVPTRTTIHATLGPGDDIQAAIDSCPAGEVVYLSAGDYTLTSSLTIENGIALRGAGPGSTRLHFTSGSAAAILIGNWYGTAHETGVSGSPAKDATSVTVTDVSGYAVGDYAVIDQIDDGVEVYNTTGETWTSRESGTRNLRQIFRITGISGRTLTIDPPLYHSYSSSFSPELRKLGGNSHPGMVTQAGVEDLYVSNDAGDAVSYNFRFLYAAHGWLKNVESYRCSVAHVECEQSFGCEIRDSYYHHAWGQGGGGQGYGVSLYEASTAVLVENNVFFHLRHPMTASQGPSGCVFAYNYSTYTYASDSPWWLSGAIVMHGGHPHMNLFEGNYVEQISMDDTHCSGAHDTAFRNYAVGDSTYPGTTSARRCIDVESHNRYHNVLGNVLGDSKVTWDDYDAPDPPDPSRRHIYVWGRRNQSTEGGPLDPQAKATALRHGNFDNYNRQILWDASISDHNLPDSLYLTNKPAFFECRPWPSVDPLTGTVTSLPAKDRFDGVTYLCGGGGDTTPPVSSSHNPDKNAVNVPVNASISLHIEDGGDGVDSTKIAMHVDGAQAAPSLTGTASDYVLLYDAPADFQAGQIVEVTVRASDLHSPPNQMEETYTFSISQSGQSCNYSATDPTNSFAWEGGSTSSTVRASAGCLWTAASSVDWIGVSPANGVGDGSVAINVESNAGEARSGTVAVAGSSFTISQEPYSGGGCTDCPTITSITAKTAKAGSIATIRGDGFGIDRKKIAVFFGTKAVKRILKLKDTLIRLKIPRGISGTVDVYVVVNGKTSNMVQFELKS
ncbi:MAG: IPT/TIG domain-containing protein [Acidobacteria bacterium]|nr:IPT/TIG domain-containing protein [Acidobacteriota bacterium]